MTAANVCDSITDPAIKRMIEADLGAIARGPDANARGIAFTIEPPLEADVGTIVIRPTTQH